MNAALLSKQTQLQEVVDKVDRLQVLLDNTQASRCCANDGGGRGDGVDVMVMVW